MTILEIAIYRYIIHGSKITFFRHILYSKYFVLHYTKQKTQTIFNDFHLRVSPVAAKVFESEFTICENGKGVKPFLK